ncbi:MAG: Lon-like protease helical domain-containing protein, partial [Aestuariivirgaceae bacterium]
MTQIKAAARCVAHCAWTFQHPSKATSSIMATRKKPTAPAVKPLPVPALRSRCDAKALGFKSTGELEPIETLIGQDRALGAIRFGTSIDRPGYNIFVLGPQGTGRHTAILSYLKQRAGGAPAPDDWAYVHNFASAHRPQALRLPAGIAIPFRDSMAELIEDLRSAIPSQFRSDDYREKRQAIDAEVEETQEKAFEELRQKAQGRDVGILRTPMGFALAPMHDGQVLKPEVFNALPEGQRKSIEAKIDELQKDLAAILERLPLLDKHRREQIRKLNAELTGMIVDASIKAVADRFASIEAIQNRLVEIRQDLVQNVEMFLPQSDGEAETAPPRQPMAQTADPRFNRYLVNVMIANNGDGDRLGAPMVNEDHPTLSNLVGRIEHLSQFGALITDFT